jgi:hypothetical protein
VSCPRRAVAGGSLTLAGRLPPSGRGLRGFLKQAPCASRDWRILKVEGRGGTSADHSCWIRQLRGLAMMTKQLSLAMILSVCVGSGVAWSNLKTAPSVPAAKTKTDFDQVFADATRQGEFNAAGTVNRALKSDRLPSFKRVLLEPLLLPHCEPVASRFADPILGRIVGRCAA